MSTWKFESSILPLENTSSLPPCEGQTYIFIHTQKIPSLLQGCDKVLAIQIIAKHWTNIQRPDAYTPKFQPGLKESYNKLRGYVSHINK